MHKDAPFKTNKSSKDPRLQWLNIESAPHLAERAFAREYRSAQPSPMTGDCTGMWVIPDATLWVRRQCHRDLLIVLAFGIGLSGPGVAEFQEI